MRGSVQTGTFQDDGRTRCLLFFGDEVVLIILFVVLLITLFTVLLEKHQVVKNKVRLLSSAEVSA